MTEYDLHKMYFAEYIKGQNGIGYGSILDAGEAMNTGWEFSYAEGSLYAKSALSEFLRKATGGNVSVAVKYLPAAVQQLLFGDVVKSHSITYTDPATSTSVTAAVEGLAYGANAIPKAVGFAGYARGLLDGVHKVMAFRLARCLFGKPSTQLVTLGGDTITFATPTTTGRFMADHTADQNMIEIAVLDNDAAADAWCRALLPPVGGGG